MDDGAFWRLVGRKGLMTTASAAAAASERAKRARTTKDMQANKQLAHDIVSSVRWFVCDGWMEWMVSYCCRRMLLSHVDLIEKLLNYNSTYLRTHSTTANHLHLAPTATRSQQHHHASPSFSSLVIISLTSSDRHGAKEYRCGCSWRRWRRRDTCP